MNKKKYPQITVRLNQELLDQLKSVSQTQDRTIGKVVKMALEKYLHETYNKTP
jgi:predicted DNA-binding protein